MIDSPIVMFSDITVEQIVSYWLDINIDFVSSYLGIILNKLGFNSDDNVYVYGYTKDSYLLFKVNNEEYFKILMSSKRLNNGYNPVVYYEEYGYECIIDKYGRFDISFVKMGYDNQDVTRLIENGSSYEDINVSKDGKDIEFRISRIGNGLKDKDEILKYLNGLGSSDSVLDIYKNIYERYLNRDISGYPLIDLRIIIDNEIKEMIVLADGKLVNLLVNNNGRMISCDNTGYWSCESDSSLVDFSVTKSNGIIDFSSKVRPKGNIEDYSLELASHDINIAKKEITNVKRLVKRMFDK